jgi:hypothetical protein
MTLQYLAGIIDGEGHFCRPAHTNGRGERHRQSRIIVTNTCKELLDAIKQTYGGYYYQRTKSATNNLPSYAWVLNGKKAEALARKLRPFLIVKQEQVKRLFPPYPGYSEDGHVIEHAYQTNRIISSRRKT